MALFEFTATPESVTIIVISCLALLLVMTLSLNPAKTVMGSFPGLKKSQAAVGAHYFAAFCLVGVSQYVGFVMLAFGHSM